MLCCAVQLDMAGVDDVDREVEFQPMKGVPCDPRHMIAGHDEGLDGSWTSGFFDKGIYSSGPPCGVMYCGDVYD